MKVQKWQQHYKAKHLVTECCGFAKKYIIEIDIKIGQKCSIIRFQLDAIWNLLRLSNIRKIHVLWFLDKHKKKNRQKVYLTLIDTWSIVYIYIRIWIILDEMAIDA